MKSMIAGVVAGVLFGATTLHAAELETQNDKVNYIIGYNLGKQLGADGFELQEKALIAGFKASLGDKESQISPQETQMVMQQFQMQAQAKRQAAGQSNLKKGEEFLSSNKDKKGVKALESGLQYEVVKMGDGGKPKATDTVKVHYKGVLIGGEEFDSSYKRNEPAIFPVNRVIPGWTEILQLMPEGSHWKVYIPSHMAYGERGAPPKIGPNSVLIFDIELLEIQKQEG